MRKFWVSTLMLALASWPGISAASLALKAVGSAPELDAARLIEVKDEASTLPAMVNVTHEAIPEIGWPGMTMDMALLSGARIQDVKAGERVWMVLSIGPDGAYAIKELAPSTRPKPMLHSGDVLARGVVNRLPQSASPKAG